MQYPLISPVHMARPGCPCCGQSTFHDVPEPEENWVVLCPVCHRKGPPEQRKAYRRKYEIFLKSLQDPR